MEIGSGGVLMVVQFQVTEEAFSTSCTYMSLFPSKKLWEFLSCIIQQNLSKVECEWVGNLLNVNKSYSPGQKNWHYSVIYSV
jgi:hypothetical protein